MRCHDYCYELIFNYFHTIYLHGIKETYAICCKYQSLQHGKLDINET